MDNFDEFLKEYEKNVDLNRAKLISKEIDNLHMVLGMVTESAELADAYKRKIAYGTQLDFVNMVEEVGDIMWYIIGFCNINNITLRDVLEANMNKLKSRYKNGFTVEEALNRDLDSEREELEKINSTQ